MIRSCSLDIQSPIFSLPLVRVANQAEIRQNPERSQDATRVKRPAKS